MKHDVRRKDKESFSSSTTIEALTTRGMGSNHRKEKGDISKSTTGNRKLEKKTSVLSARKKDIRRLIVQGSRRRIDRNQRQTSHMWMMVFYWDSISQISYKYP